MSSTFFSGRCSLDYVGTVRWRRSHEPYEYLAEPSDLATWATTKGLVDEPPRVTLAQLASAREIREAIYRVLSARVAHVIPTAADVAALNTAAQRPPVQISLGADGSVHRVGTVSQLLSTVARDVLDLLGSDQIDLVRECDGHDCTRLYVDSSRARNRRWCSNTECGNKANDRTPFVGPPRVRVGCWIRVAEQGSDRAGRIGQALDERAAWEMRGRRRGAERSEA